MGESLLVWRGELLEVIISICVTDSGDVIGAVASWAGQLLHGGRGRLHGGRGRLHDARTRLHVLAAVGANDDPGG